MSESDEVNYSATTSAEERAFDALLVAAYRGFDPEALQAAIDAQAAEAPPAGEKCPLCGSDRMPSDDGKTVATCPVWSERPLGEPRCPNCGLFCRFWKQVAELKAQRDELIGEADAFQCEVASALGWPDGKPFVERIRELVAALAKQKQLRLLPSLSKKERNPSDEAATL
jgi:hypothetical protein